MAASRIQRAKQGAGETPCHGNSAPRGVTRGHLRGARAWAIAGAGGAGLVSMTVLSSAQPYANVAVSGNQFLASDDILAVCEITPQDDFSAATQAEIRACLMSTGQFANVAFAPEGDTMNVEVEELNSRPGRLEFGLRYDSQQAFMGTFYLERYNLFPGVFGALELNFSKEYKGADLNLFKADGLAPGWDMGLDLAAFETDFGDQAHDHRQVRIEPYLARDIGPEGRLEFGLGYRRDGILDVDPGASALTRAEAGTRQAPYLRLGYTHQTATARWSLQQHVFGLGSDDVVSRTTLSYDRAIALPGDGLSLNLRLGGGHVAALTGGAPRISDRFLVGGDQLRGFAPRGVGPRDGAEALGGESHLLASVEVLKDIGDIWGTPARLGGFLDTGTAWGLSNSLSGAVDDDLYWRASVGVSLTLDIMDVPLSVYVAQPIRKRAGDDLQQFGLSISARF
ncbi:BamA/TamA family outer membrane protein [Pseudooceanicola aestuarii]|uniref:BamA/TamA family outer membrane protein n=1 Tax=Pseudooceanicola aestuarii TaxID=2697319 RepID=UPI0013CF60E8|nr:BamA/TamA family outer membrane protein [Pseudooceanicola aestuarii]